MPPGNGLLKQVNEGAVAEASETTCRVSLAHHERKIAPTFVLRTLVLHFAGTIEWARSSSRLYSLPEGSFMETLTYTHSNSNRLSLQAWGEGNA